MTTHGNKELSLRIIEEVWNNRNLNAIDDVYAPSGDGHAAMKQFVGAYLDAFPDLHITVIDQIAEDDRVATRYTAEATHTGAFAGIPPTGERMRTTGIETHRFVDGQLVDVWNSIDLDGIAQQLRSISHRSIVRRWYGDYINSHNVDALDELVSPDFTSHFLSGAAGKDRNELKLIDGALFAALPDLHMTIEDIVAELDRVTVRYSSRATLNGSGTPVSGSGMDFFRVVEGKIAQRWAEMDYTGFLQSIGAPG